jgi:NADPH-dependent stearoyl-CoA 9-desaturase
MVQRTILRLAFPGGEPRPKPGPYRPAEAEAAATNGRRPVPDPGPTGPHGSGPERPDEGVRVLAPSREA